MPLPERLRRGGSKQNAFRLCPSHELKIFVSTKAGLPLEPESSTLGRPT